MRSLDINFEYIIFNLKKNKTYFFIYIYENANTVYERVLLVYLKSFICISWKTFCSRSDRNLRETSVLYFIVNLLIGDKKRGSVCTFVRGATLVNVFKCNVIDEQI